MDNLAMTNMKQDILREYAEHKSLFKTAKKLGVQITLVREVIKDLPKIEPPNTSQFRYDGFGDPKKKKYYVARMLATEVWNNEIPEVAEARRAFEAGTHNLGTGRDGPYIILYSFPQIVKTPRPGYFNLTTED